MVNWGQDHDAIVAEAYRRDMSNGYDMNDYASATIAHNRRKQEEADAEAARLAQDTSADVLLGRILAAIRGAHQKKYPLSEIMQVSPESHAEELRKQIEADVLEWAHRLNVTPTY